MVNDEYDYTTYDPTILSDAASDLGSAASSVLSSPSTGGEPGSNSNGSGSLLDATGNAVDTTVSSLLDTIPGASDVIALLAALKSTFKPIGSDLEIIAGQNLQTVIRQNLNGLQWAEHFYKFVTGPGWKEFTNLTTGTLFTEMLHYGLGLDIGKLREDAGDAINTIDTMLGFALVMQSFGIAVDIVGKGLLGGRWSEGISQIITRLTEDMGLSWALGITIEESFKQAQGVVLEEAINQQKRPNRIEWQQLRTLFQRHIIDDESVLNDLLQKQGFPDDQIRWIKKLQDVQLPIGDVQQLWYRDAIDDGQAMGYIQALGFNETDSGLLFNLYVDKSDNEATATYRSIARAMFTDHLLTEDQYRKILTDGNYPVKLIDGDIAAIQLEQSVGRVLTAVSTIKAEYQHGIINDQTAKLKLAELNYAPEYIGELVTLWTQVPLHPKHGLSQAKILSYMMSGLIKPDDAKTQLLALNLDPDTVDFLIAHPSASAGVRIHKRTPSLVTQAYVDGALNEATLQDALTSAGVAPEDMAYYVSIAQYKKASHKPIANGKLDLNAAEVRAAFKAGLFDFPTCVSRLEQLGYSNDAALILTETTNKGPYQPSGAPPFASVDQAIAFLISDGYTVAAPPDPRIAEAEAMVEMAGYSVTPPTQSGIPGGRGSLGNPTAPGQRGGTGSNEGGFGSGGTGEPPPDIIPPGG